MTSVLLVFAALACFALGRFAHGAPVAVAGTVVLVAILTALNQIETPGEYSLLDDLVWFALMLGTPAGLGVLLRKRAEAIRGLDERVHELRAARAELASAAVAEERARLAIGVHDALAHRVGEMSLQAAGARRVADSEPARAVAALGEIERSARAALDAIRDVIGVLRAGEDGNALSPGPAPHAVPAPWGVVEASDPPDAVPAPWGAGGASRSTDAVLAPRGAGEPAGATGSRWTAARQDAALALAVFAALAVETLTSSRLEGPPLANLVGVAAIAAPFAVRRRHPLAFAAAALLAAGLQALLLTPPTVLVTGMVLALVPPYTVAAHLPLRQALAGLAIVACGTLAIEPAPASAILGLVAWGAGRVVRERAARAVELRGVTAQLERARDAEPARARAEERLRVARDLHDAIAHRMTVVVLQAGAARRVWDRDPLAARAALDALVDVTRAALTDLRVALTGAPASGAQLAEIEALAARLRPLGVEVRLDRDDPLPPLSDVLDQVAFAVVLEALTNAVRHAAPTTVRVGLQRVGDTFCVEVADAGRAPDAAPPAAVTGTGTGLRGMAERVGACGGELSYGAADDGFRVVARLPLEVAA